MKSFSSILGIILILLGIFGLAYGGFEYTTREQVAHIGDVTITEDTGKWVNFSPIAGGACLVAGLALVYISRRK